MAGGLRYQIALPCKLPSTPGGEVAIGRLMEQAKNSKRDESARCYCTHYECCVVLAPHGLVQGGDAILCPEVQMRTSTLQHLDDVGAALQLSCQR